MCVKNITVSSRENQAMRLIDGNEGYWQSSGAQGKVGVSAFGCLISSLVASVDRRGLGVNVYTGSVLFTGCQCRPEFAKVERNFFF